MGSYIYKLVLTCLLKLCFACFLCLYFLSLYCNIAKEEKLQQICDDPLYANPKLAKMKEIILGKMTEDSRGIVFCKTRVLTLALERWMKESQELRRFNAVHFTGAGVNEELGGTEITFFYAFIFRHLPVMK